MTCLQISFKQRMKKHKHDTLIKNFCEQIKHRLFKTRKRHRRNVDETSMKRKIKWKQTICIKLSTNEKKSDAFINKVFIKLFLMKWKQSWKIRSKWKIDANFVKGYWRTFRSEE
jgi:hypothetical protein